MDDAESEEYAFQLQLQEFEGGYAREQPSNALLPQEKTKIFRGSSSRRMPLHDFHREIEKSSIARIHRPGLERTYREILQRTHQGAVDCRPDHDVPFRNSASFPPLPQSLLLSTPDKIDRHQELREKSQTQVSMMKMGSTSQNRSITPAQEDGILDEDELLAVMLQFQDLEQDNHQTQQNEMLAVQLQMEDLEGEPESRLYDLYFAEARDDRVVVGFSCVVKDAGGEVVFEREGCLGAEVSYHFAEYTALLCGLSYAQSMGLSRINAHGSRAFVYCEVSGLIQPESDEQQRLMDELQAHVKELTSFKVDCISATENQTTIRLAERGIKLADSLQTAPGQSKPGYVLKTRSTKFDKEAKKIANAGSSKLKHLMIRLNENDEDELRDCIICFEKTFPSDMVCLKSCKHEICFFCLSQHIGYHIRERKVPVPCPAFSTCKKHLSPEECRGLLSAELFDTYTSRLAESTVSDPDKVYCPYPDCSAMTYRSTADDHEEVDEEAYEQEADAYEEDYEEDYEDHYRYDYRHEEGSRRTGTTIITARSSSPRHARRIGAAECMECHRLFCSECGVPWHGGRTCEEYQRVPTAERDADFSKLCELAKGERWRQCKGCRQMISLSHGCFHMTCRCGFEFCYICETPYVDKHKQCLCPLFAQEM